VRVVCTAGHVDHGKSTLVRALTGMEPDRLAEEQRRGLTIDLGFAWTQVGSGTVAFVDLPGHERFVGTMLAGAGAVELALFVVAADEGWMPQSAEHLAILDLLGVRHGVVALTKADAVDAETASLGAELVAAELAGTGLAGAEVVPVSAASGAGLGALRAALGRMLAAAPAPVDAGRPRLWVDRSFSVRGAGTVVTGTLTGGAVATGEELALLPGRRAVRVRGLQELGRPVAEARPGSRVAVNLTGVERGEVGRGDALVRPEQWRGVVRFDAAVRALGGPPIDRSGAWRLHAGSGERTAAVYPIGGRPIAGEGFVRVELEGALALTAGDRVVLREAGRRLTVGGGVVLDPDPPERPRGTPARTRRSAQLAARAQALAGAAGAGAGGPGGAEQAQGWGGAAAAAAGRARLVVLHLAEREVAALSRVAAAAGVTGAQAVAAARAAGSPVLTVGGLAHAVDRESARTWGQAVVDALRDHHRARPLDRTAPRDVAARAAVAAGCPSALAPAFLDLLVGAGAVAAEGSGMRLPRHRVQLDGAQAATRDALVAALAAEPFAPPALSVAVARAQAPAALVRELEQAGTIVRLGPDLAVPAGTLDLAVARLAGAARAEGPLTAARAKEVLGTSRKYALPLLEELDRRGRTRRRGDVRDVLG